MNHCQLHGQWPLVEPQHNAGTAIIDFEALQAKYCPKSGLVGSLERNRVISSSMIGPCLQITGLKRTHLEIKSTVVVFALPVVMEYACV